MLFNIFFNYYDNGGFSMITLKEIKDLWFYCYNEDLKTQYSGFYKRLEKLEKTIDKEERDKNDTKG